MSKTPKYDDLSKSNTDFFSKLFPASLMVKVGTETVATDDGNKFIIKTTTSRLVIEEDKKTKEVLDCTVEPKYETKGGYILEGKFQTNNELSATVSKTHPFADGQIKIGFTGTQRIQEDTVEQTITGSGEFSHQKIATKIQAAFPLESRAYKANGDAVVQILDNLYFGIKTEIEYLKSLRVKKGECKLAGTYGTTSGHLTGNFDRVLGLLATHNLNSENTIGFNVTVALPQEGKEVKENEKAKPSSTKIGVTIAGQHKLSKDSAVQSKISLNTELQSKEAPKKPLGIRLGFGFSQNLNSHASCTLGADVNVGSFLFGSAGGLGHSLGFEIKLK